MPTSASRKLYEAHTVPADQVGREGQKRLQEEFGDRRIQLRWHPESKQLQVWYVPDNSEIYCIESIGPPYDVARLVYDLRRRQRSGKEQLQEYLAAQRQKARDRDRRIEAVGQSISSYLKNRLKGKVTLT